MPPAEAADTNDCAGAGTIELGVSALGYYRGPGPTGVSMPDITGNQPDYELKGPVY